MGPGLLWWLLEHQQLADIIDLVGSCAYLILASITGYGVSLDSFFFFLHLAVRSGISYLEAEWGQRCLLVARRPAAALLVARRSAAALLVARRPAAAGILSVFRLVQGCH